MSIDTKSFDNILSKIIKSESGIKKVILADRTGLTIASVSKFSYFPADVDGIGAITSAVFCASEEQGKSLELGDLEIITNEFLGGKIFASSCGPKGVLTLISDPDINIGLIRLILKRSGDELKEILDEFLSDIPETLDSGLDLSDLDFPYPYIFKPPSPPDDLALAPRVQLHTSPKKKAPEEIIHCQYCGIKLTKEEQFTHSCKKKPE